MKTLNYSNITLNDLEDIFDINKDYDRENFKTWFLKEYKTSKEESIFLEKLINRHISKIINYTELELISKEIAPILNMVNFDLEDKHKYLTKINL